MFGIGFSLPILLFLKKVLRRLVKVSPENSLAERVKNFTRSPFLPNAFLANGRFCEK
jgi:hypothetical protein